MAEKTFQPRTIYRDRFGCVRSSDILDGVLRIYGPLNPIPEPKIHQGANAG